MLHPNIWSPRSGLVAVSQRVAPGREVTLVDPSTGAETTYGEALFVFSGFGGNVAFIFTTTSNLSLPAFEQCQRNE